MEKLPMEKQFYVIDEDGELVGLISKWSTYVSSAAFNGGFYCDGVLCSLEQAWKVKAKLPPHLREKQVKWKDTNQQAFYKLPESEKRKLRAKSVKLKPKQKVRNRDIKGKRLIRFDV